jgi:DNA-binding NtrC family response regulator
MNYTDSMKIARDVVRLLSKQNLKELVREIIKEEMIATEHPVDIKEAAAILGISHHTLYKRNDIPYVTQGRKRCYYPSQLRECMQK